MGTYVSLAYHLRPSSPPPSHSPFFLSSFVLASLLLLLLLPHPNSAELPSLRFPFSSARRLRSPATCSSPVRLAHPPPPTKLPRVPRVIEVTLHGALGYVVCPIFTHGKSTLKRRWSPPPLSLSPFLSRSFSPPPPCFQTLLLLLLFFFSASYSSPPIFFLHPLLRLLFNKRRSPLRSAHNNHSDAFDVRDRVCSIWRKHYPFSCQRGDGVLFRGEGKKRDFESL